jgi:replicative DNA helicase
MTNPQPKRKPQIIPIDERKPVRDAPYSQEAEEAVIGAILVNPNAFELIAGIISANDFFFIRHGHIWRAMQALRNDNQTIDIVSLQSKLTELKALEESGGMAYFVQLSRNVPSSANARLYADIVRLSSVRRQLSQRYEVLSQMALDTTTPLGDLGEYIREAETIYITSQSGGAQSAKDVALEHANLIDHLAQSPGAIGVNTGLYDLDRQTTGIHKNTVTWAVGRPGHGKSAFMIQVALNAAAAGKRVVFYNAGDANEMAIMTRMAAIIGNVPASIIKTGQVAQSAEQYSAYLKALQTISAFPLHIKNNIGATTDEIEAEALRLKHEHGGVDLLIIDYYQMLQLGDARARDEYQKLLRIAKLVTEMSKRDSLDCAILIGAQAHRAVEQRKDPQPKPSDIKGCGGAEETAEVVISLRRPYVENQQSGQSALGDDPSELICEIGKNRQTGTYGRILLRFDDKTTAIQSAHNPFI